jgi:RHS repeat-associated protein
LPLLVDDGSKAYLHADGLLAEIDAANAATYPLGDILGSVRGLTNGSGTVTGSASYDVFGAIRSQSGAISGFGFTGEQRDATTGFTYLRARYLNPALGRFGSQDTVQPNAPGTQGYNLYTYVANNPTTWVDPSGHYGNTPGYGFLECMEKAAFALGYGVLLLSLAERVVNPVATAAIAFAAMPFFALGIFTALACVVEMLLTVALAIWGGYPTRGTCIPMRLEARMIWRRRRANGRDRLNMGRGGTWCRRRSTPSGVGLMVG